MFFGQTEHIPIAELFNYIEARWDEYWVPGIKNCKQEMEFYELLSYLDVEPEASGGVLTVPPPSQASGSQISDAIFVGEGFSDT